VRRHDARAAAAARKDRECVRLSGVVLWALLPPLAPMMPRYAPSVDVLHADCMPLHDTPLFRLCFATLMLMPLPMR